MSRSIRVLALGALSLLGSASAADPAPGGAWSLLRGHYYPNREFGEVDEGFMEAATGRPVQHLECLVRGGSACRFRLGARTKS